MRPVRLSKEHAVNQQLPSFSCTKAGWKLRRAYPVIGIEEAAGRRA
jgi:hypothetical protein